MPMGVFAGELWTGHVVTGQTQDCNIQRFSFQPGEEARYRISYNWLLLWTDVGEVWFSAKESRVKEIPCLHLLAVGATYKSWDWFFKVRNLDLSGCRINDTIPITLLLDNEIYNIYFRYLGTEKKKIRKLGEIDCMKFSAMLIQGSVFNGGEKMYIWVTNDKNRLPVYIESPILVGSVRGTLIGIKGNRYPLDFRK